MIGNLWTEWQIVYKVSMVIAITAQFYFHAIVFMRRKVMKENINILQNALNRVFSRIDVKLGQNVWSAHTKSFAWLEN